MHCLKLNEPIEKPLVWRAAHRYGQHYIHQAAARYGFEVEREQSLFLDGNTVLTTTA